MDQNQIFQSAQGLSKPNPRRECIEIKSLDTFKCINNKVLIKIDVSAYETLGSGFMLGDEQYEFSANRYNVAVHSVRHGEIVKQVDTFYYSPSKNGLQDHKTEIETLIGDDVFFPTGESENCPLFRFKNDYYLLMDYEILYLAKRKTSVKKIENQVEVNGSLFDIIMLNGFILCERVYDEIKSSISLEDKVLNKKYAKVVYLGNPVEYRSPKHISAEGIKIGDIIILTNYGAEVMLEDELHLFFDGMNTYRVVQRKFVMGVKYE